MLTHLSGNNTRVPEEEELITVNIDTSEQSRAQLQLQLTPRCGGSTSPDLWVGGSVSPDPSGAAPDRSPYRRQPLRARKYNPRSNFWHHAGSGHVST